MQCLYYSSTTVPRQYWKTALVKINEVPSSYCTWILTIQFIDYFSPKSKKDFVDQGNWFQGLGENILQHFFE